MQKDIVMGSIPEITEAAGMEMKRLVLEKAGKTERFPKVELRGGAGCLEDCAGVVVDYGVPVSKEGRVRLAERDAVVLLPEGLFVGRPVETLRKDNSYSTAVPAVDQLRQAPIETYLQYGARALKMLEDNIRAQFAR